MLFKKETPTPSQRLTTALAGLERTALDVIEAKEALYTEQAQLVERLSAVTADAERANTVATNLNTLLGY